MTALCAIFGANAAVDLNAVKVDVTMNPVKYKELMQRFVDGDHTLSTDQMSTVYYGFPYTPGYNPAEDYSDIEHTYATGDYAAALSKAETALVDDPVSLELNLYALAAAEKLKADGKVDTMKTLKLGNRCEMLSSVILESGRGTSAESPFIINDSSDIDYMLRNVFGVDKIIGQTTVGDVIAVKFTFPGNDRQHILYFDNAPERAHNNNK